MASTLVLTVEIAGDNELVVWLDASLTIEERLYLIGMVAKAMGVDVSKLSQVADDTTIVRKEQVERPIILGRG